MAVADLMRAVAMIPARDEGERRPSRPMARPTQSKTDQGVQTQVETASVMEHDLRRRRRRRLFKVDVSPGKAGKRRHTPIGRAGDGKAIGGIHPLRIRSMAGVCQRTSDVERPRNRRHVSIDAPRRGNCQEDCNGDCSRLYHRFTDPALRRHTSEFIQKRRFCQNKTRRVTGVFTQAPYAVWMYIRSFMETGYV